MNRRPASPVPVAFLLLPALMVGCFVEVDPSDPELSSLYQELETCPGDVTVDGIDVSYWQGAIDWDDVAASGIAFAFIRVSDGLYEDTRFDENWAEARRVGIIRGVYQYFRPGTDPFVQADLLLRRMGDLEPGDLPPVLDVEADDDQPPSVIVSRVGDWIDAIEAATGRIPIIYTAKYFWQDNVASDIYADYPLWVAHYGVSCPNLPNQWTSWIIWQTGSTGRVPGISGNVDTDLWNGDLQSLLDFTTWEAECGDGYCNGDETHDSCPGDCPICEPIPPEGRVVEETEICFEAGGEAQYWRYENDGHNGGLMWTHTTAADEEDNFGVWHLDLEEGGLYGLEAYTDSSFAQSRSADYQVRHGGVVDTIEVDQTLVDGWTMVGEFSFAAGGDQWVRLNDNTGEPLSTNTQIVMDAIRLTRLDLPEPDAGQPQQDVSPQADLAPSDRPGQDWAATDLSLPDIAWPDYSLPDMTLPDVTLPDMTLPDLVLPDGSLADWSWPDWSMPDYSMPDWTWPDYSLPEAGPAQTDWPHQDLAAPGQDQAPQTDIPEEPWGDDGDQGVPERPMDRPQAAAGCGC